MQEDEITIKTPRGKRIMRKGMVIEVAELCAICGKETQGKALHYDHDHITGEFRGWLCRSCNLGLGNFKDSLGLLRGAAVYLEAKERPYVSSPNSTASPRWQELRATIELLDNNKGPKLRGVDIT